jgi:hypothetical protein
LGRKEEAIKIAKDLEAQHDQNPSAEANIALICVGLRDQDQAMIWLNKGYEARFNPSILLRPAFDPLRPTLNSRIFFAVSGSRDEVKYFRDRGGRHSRCGTNNFGALDAQRVIMQQILSNMAA